MSSRAAMSARSRLRCLITRDDCSDDAFAVGGVPFGGSSAFTGGSVSCGWHGRGGSWRVRRSPPLDESASEMWVSRARAARQWGSHLGHGADTDGGAAVCGSDLDAAADAFA